MREALTFHASFDKGPDADFARGDATLYSVQDETGELTKGPGQLTIDNGRLTFTRASTHVVAYKAEGNVAYSPAAFRGTVSLWLAVDPADIPGQYCDPLQVTDKKYSDSCIWLDFTKNDTPSDLRLGVFGELAGWDVKGKESDSQEFYYRLAKVAEPPFAREKLTHVAVTWEGINSSQSGRARLYIDGVYQGATGVIRERFVWDPARARIRLGTGKYVGQIDDLAFFDRPLSAEEIRTLQSTRVSSLY